jgi:hypothetical protein
MLITATQPVASATTTVPLTMHDKFRGDAESVKRSVLKKGASGTKNAHLIPKLVNIDTDKLVPLESQRVTKEKWTEKRLLALNGLDMWAFGTLSVCLDIRDNTYYVWDGCGRLALAQLHGLTTVPCIVIEGEKEQAAFYFGYNQDSTQGRRTLSKEVLFVNRYYSGDQTAINEADLLALLGLYVKGDTDYSVPNPTPIGYVEIGYRAFAEGNKIANEDIPLQRHARDMIVSAWSNNPNGCRFINQDIYWALIQFFVTYPDARKNGLNTRLQQFLTHIATGKDQSKVTWKEKGLSGNSGVSKILALGLLKAFKDSIYYKNDNLVAKRLKDGEED